VIGHAYHLGYKSEDIRRVTLPKLSTQMYQNVHDLYSNLRQVRYTLVPKVVTLDEMNE